MSDDILAEWKSNRFVRYAADEFNVRCVHVLVLTDIPFWNEHADQLKEWCNIYNCRIQGLTVEIPTDTAYSAFCLKWM